MHSLSTIFKMFMFSNKWSSGVLWKTLDMLPPSPFPLRLSAAWAVMHEWAYSTVLCGRFSAGCAQLCDTVQADGQITHTVHLEACAAFTALNSALFSPRNILYCGDTVKGTWQLSRFGNTADRKRAVLIFSQTFYSQIHVNIGPPPWFPCYCKKPR